MGFAGGAAIWFGGGASMGIATSLSAGVCGVANAAQDEGLLTAEQVDQVFNRAVENIRAPSRGVEIEADRIVCCAGDCDALLGMLNEAASN